MPEKMFLPTPKNTQLEKNLHEVKITYRWYRPIAWLYLYAGIVPNVCMFVLLIVNQHLRGSLILSLFCLIPLWYLWQGLALLLNKTQVTLSKSGISIVHQPIPFFKHKNIKLSKQTIKLVDIKQIEHRGKRSGVTYTYELFITDASRQSIKTLHHHNMDLPFYIRKKIEEYFDMPQAIVVEFY